MIYKNCVNYNNGYLYKEKNVLNNIKQIYFYTNKYFNTNKYFIQNTFKWDCLHYPAPTGTVPSTVRTDAGPHCREE